MWVLKVKVISWPWPKVSYIIINYLKLAFLRNHLANQSQILYVSFQVQGNENLCSFMHLCLCHFLTLAQGHLHTKLKTCFSQKPLGQSKLNFICKLSGTRKWKFIDMMLVTWPKWLPRPYMVKTLQKSSSLEPVDRFPQNFIGSVDDSCPS